MHTVHVRINDAATGKPTPCRVRFTDAEGRYYAPFGRMTEIPTKPGQDVGGNVLDGYDAYAYMDGACEIRLPTGRIRVRAHKGFEYRPLDESVQLAAGKMALRFGLERWADLRKEGWYSGDADAVCITPHAALLEAAAEDLAVVDLLAHETNAWNHAAMNILAFSGQQPALERPGHMVVVNTLNSHTRLGRLALLNCHRVVYPLSFGGPDGVDNWTLADWCDQCHRKGGLVVGHNFFGNYQEHPHGEILADLVLGKIDAVVMNSSFEHPDHPVLHEWHALLGAGLRTPLVGGSGKSSNLSILGDHRSYARLLPGQELTYRNWTEAVRAGRTFVTNGPLLSFTVNGQDPGTVLDLPSSHGKVRVRAEAKSLAPFDRLEILSNGAVVAQAEAAGSPSRAAVEAEIAMTDPGWLAARCWGPYVEGREDWVGAQTSPVYVRIDSKSPRPDAAAVAPFLAKLEKMLEWVEREARCPTDRDRQRLAAVFEAAKQELLRRQRA
jgi:hypothetical protein